MSKKQIIVDIAVYAVCIAILISVSLVTLTKNDVSAGAGGGVSARIENIEQAGQMLKSFQPRLNGYTFGDEVAAVSLTEEDEKNYSSVTVSVASSGDMDYVYTYGSLNSDSGYYNHREADMEFERTLTAYLTENASYYISEFKIFSYSLNESGKGKMEDLDINENKMYMYGSFHIYIEKDFVMLRIDRADCIIDGEIITKRNDALGKWIYFSNEEKNEYQEVISSFEATDDNNFKVLLLLGEYLGKTDCFKRTGGRYELMEQYSNTFFNALISAQLGAEDSYFDSESDKGAFQVDLSDRVSPIITLSVSSEFVQRRETVDSLFGSYVKPAINYSCTGADVFKFSNINNTEVKAPSVRGCITPEEYFELTED